MQSTIKHAAVIGGSIAALMGAADLAHSSDIKAPFALETTQVLPKMIRNPRFIDVFTAVDQKWGDSGQVLPLGDKLNKTVTWNDILDAQWLDGKPDTAKRAAIQGMVNSLNANSDPNQRAGNGPGQTTGQVNTYANVKVPALAMGITDRITVAVAVPLVHVDVSTDTGFIASRGGNNFVNAASSSSSPLTGEEAQNKLNNAINEKLTRLGYEPIHSMTIDHPGDVQAVIKYRAFDDSVNSVAFKETFILPTGTAPNVDRALDIPTGDGRFEVGTAVIYDRQLNGGLRWDSTASWLAAVPRRIDRRLPVSDDDSLSDLKENLHENLRHQFGFSTGLDQMFPSIGLRLGAGYGFGYQTKASFADGTASPDPYRYRLLEDLQPIQVMHSALLGAGFSTVEWFKEKKFVYPFQLNVAYSKPLAGRNVPTNELVAAELVLFF